MFLNESFIASFLHLPSRRRLQGYDDSTYKVQTLDFHATVKRLKNPKKSNLFCTCPSYPSRTFPSLSLKNLYNCGRWWNSAMTSAFACRPSVTASKRVPGWAMQTRVSQLLLSDEILEWKKWRGMSDTLFGHAFGNDVDTRRRNAVADHEKANCGTTNT